MNATYGRLYTWQGAVSFASLFKDFGLWAVQSPKGLGRCRLRKTGGKTSPLSGAAFYEYVASHSLHITAGKVQSFSEGAFAVGQAGMESLSPLEELLLLLGR